MNKEEQNFLNEDEIDLRELFNLLLEKKIFIIIFTAIITIGAIFYVYIKTPIYEVKSNVQIGFIGKDLIAEPNTLVKNAKLVFNVEDKLSTKEKFISEVVSINSIKNLKNFIEIKTDAISNDEALTKNKEVVVYIQNKYKKVINQFLYKTNNKIKDLELNIYNLQNLAKKNVERQIELIKNQEIIKVDEKIHFYKMVKLPSTEQKMAFLEDKLAKYTHETNKIYKENKNTTNTTNTLIASFQMLNYQNLIFNSENSLEDLKLEKEKINIELIPALKRKKQNIENDDLRKLKYKLKIELPNKIEKIRQQINDYKYQMSAENVQNSHVVGKYVIDSSPIKPKKTLIIIVAFITGLILSIFIVFFLKFISNNESKNNI